MTQSVQPAKRAQFTIANIGGISRTEVELPPGVTVLAGENATNRTSFLQSIMAAMGSDLATLKGDADEGRVEFSYGGEAYERTFSRAADGTVTSGGDAYLDDPSVAELFCFLLESNEARRAVARGDNLRDLIMRPVDVDELKALIREVRAHKEEINDQLATIESLKRDLPELEKQRRDLEDRIESERAELAELEAEIDDESTDTEQPREGTDRLEEKLETLRDRRGTLNDTRDKIESQDQSVEALEAERTELQSELDELEAAEQTDEPDVEFRIRELRTKKREANAKVRDLQSVITFNEEMLEDANPEIMNEIGGSPETMGDITGQLIEGNRNITCWTCGSTVQTNDVERTVTQLQDYRQEKLEEAKSIEQELEELKAEKREREQRQQRRRDVEKKLDDVEAELAKRRDRLDDLRARRTELTEEVKTLKGEVQDLRAEDFSETLERQKEANELEFEIEQLESRLEEVTEEIERKEVEIAKADDLRTRRAELGDELEDLRTRIDQIEIEAIEQFNQHMETILDILGYTNLSRIWIERLFREDTGRPGSTEETMFELHVVRSTETGEAYEDTIDHLSESEREVTGLVFALAGYLVHDLHETVPFMLLDSLEAIDSERIAALVDYFAEYAPHLVVALLPEDAQAQSDEYNRVTEI
jgi:DNA repair exonuclease SbcCD ATPase subunit